MAMRNATAVLLASLLPLAAAHAGDQEDFRHEADLLRASLQAKAGPTDADVGDADSFGKNVKWLGLLQTGSISLQPDCTPVPGDEIIGFVTRGRGVSVHRADCANAASLQEGQRDRLIEVEWDSDLSGGIFVASIEVRSLDRPGLLGDVSGVLAEHKVNIIACAMKTDRDRMASMRFDCELGDPSHLDAVLGRIRAIDGVYQSYRVLPGANVGD